MAKDEEYNRMIHTSKWLRLRRDVLTRHPLCQRCEASEEPRLVPATEVHHVKPVEEAFTHAERMARMYDAGNCMALCHDCHVKVHTEMGRSGKDANVKRTKRHVDEINSRFFGDD